MIEVEHRPTLELNHWPLGDFNEILDLKKFQYSFGDLWLKYLLCNRAELNFTGPYWISSGNGLVPSDNKPLPYPIAM